MQQMAGMLNSIRRVIKLYDVMIKPVCDQFGLSMIEIAIISFLFYNPGKDTAADIVELRMLSKGNVSQGVESLIQRNMLMRRQDTADRRRIHLSLTGQADAVIKAVEQVRQCFCRQLFQGFTEQELKQFDRMHERIAQNTKL